jgi:hypothetical protein
MESRSVLISVGGIKLPGESLFIKANTSGSIGVAVYEWYVNDTKLQLTYNTTGFSMRLPQEGTWKIDVIVVQYNEDDIKDSYTLVIDKPDSQDYEMGKKLLGSWDFLLEKNDSETISLKYNFTFMFFQDEWNASLQKSPSIFGLMGLGSYDLESNSYSILDVESFDDVNLFYTFDQIVDNRIEGYCRIMNKTTSNYINRHYFSGTFSKEVSNAPLYR